MKLIAIGKSALGGSAALSVIALFGAGLAAPAAAQTTSADACDPLVEQCDDGTSTTQGTPIVVTGSIIRQDVNDTPLPITTVTAENLDQRGISTVQEGIQTLAANNGPAITNSFTANGAFGAGASAVSLRGLTTNSTLVLFDGLRAAYYPLSDDATRNFVDLNTIPDDIVDRVEVLRDGASSAYGADAIAGVVNIITKREIQGLQLKADTSITERGDAPTYRISVTGGHGDLGRDGYNAYLSGFYYKADALYNRDRPYPFNTDDQRQICSPDGSACGPDLRINAPTNTSFAGTTELNGGNFVVAPYDPTNTTRLGRYQNLNTTGCDSLYALSAAQLAANPAAPTSVCVLDSTQNYGVISPEIERFGVSGRVTALIGDTFETYGEVNFVQSKVGYTSSPALLRSNGPAGIFFPRFSTSGVAGGANAPGSFPLTLPVYVCPQGVGSANGLGTGCNAANGTLNPNNPFAAQGQVARLGGRFLDMPRFNETRSRAYRGALGISGELTDGISLDVKATAMHIDLRRLQQGNFFIQNLLDSLAQGTLNLINPSATPQAVMDRIAPDNVTTSTSDQVQGEVVLGADLFELPGGPLQLAVGGSLRYEAINAPSANSDINGPAQRYFSINAFGTSGDRTIRSAFGAIQAPIIDPVTVNLEGRFDSYSSGQSAFSPKVSLIFEPIPDVLLLRGTYSEGFRIPAFGEANALPTTGFVTNNANLFNDTYLAQYGCTTTTFSSCPAYIRQGSYGQTTLASPNLDPEKSRSYTGGVQFTPTRNLKFAVDYYNIRKTGVITQPSNSPAIQAYYNNQAIPDIYTVIPDNPDPNFPNAKPRIAFVQSQLINANTQRTEGIDVSINGSYDFTDSIRFSSNLELSHILKLETEFPDGTVERYDGTLGNFNLTAGSGTPKWHGFWLNSLEIGDTYGLTGTVNYFGGYDLSAQDQGTGYKDCSLASGVEGDPDYSPSGCRVDDYVTFDLQGRVKINDQFTFSLTVINLFDNLPPVDIVTYGAHLYNPVQGGTGILGRNFRAAVKVNF